MGGDGVLFLGMRNREDFGVFRGRGLVDPWLQAGERILRSIIDPCAGAKDQTEQERSSHNQGGNDSPFDLGKIVHQEIQRAAVTRGGL